MKGFGCLTGVGVFVTVFIVMLIVSIVNSCREMNFDQNSVIIDNDRSPEQVIGVSVNRPVSPRKSRILRNSSGKIVLVGREEGGSIIWRNSSGKIEYIEKL